MVDFGAIFQTLFYGVLFWQVQIIYGKQVKSEEISSSNDILVKNTVDDWDVVRNIIDNYNMENVAVSVVNASGIQFLYEKGNTSYTETVMNVASTTKWCSGLAIMKVVSDGYMKLDDYVHEYFDYWTSDPSDPRSRITLRHLLSFTSGYWTKSFGSTVDCFYNASMPYLDCVKELYDTVPLTYEPGTVWDYSSLHLKIAGGMASMASGKDIVTLLNETMFDTFGFDPAKSYYDNGVNPELAGSLWTTGEDYNKLLEKVYHYKADIDFDLQLQMERDETPENKVRQSLKSLFLAVAVGHYGLANWTPECWINNPQALDKTCYEESIHTSPGIFGYYPLIDRSRNYWMQIVYDGKVFLGCIDGWALRGIIKPEIDKIMEKEQGLIHHSLDRDTSPWYQADGKFNIHYFDTVKLKTQETLLNVMKREPIEEYYIDQYSREGMKRENK